MLQVLRLEGYRSFEGYELSDLARVNLLVGKNNCGKTSLLEAIELLASKGDPYLLLRSANRRGEESPLRDPEERPPRWRANITHLFHGHDLLSNSSIRLDGSPGPGSITMRIRPLTADESNGGAAPSLFEEAKEGVPALGLEISGNTPQEIPVLPVGLDGSLRFPRHPIGLDYSRAASELPPTQLLTPRSLDPGSMRTMWDRVQIEGRESEVTSAVRLVVDELESIHFLTGDRSPASLGGAGVLVGLRGGARRMPLGSQGDGMRRFLALSLSLINSAGGFLLVDEIDAGLHWTVMRAMWQFVIEAARQSSVQVFATTHSLDCIRGLALLRSDRPDLASEVAAYKLDRRLPRAVRFDAEEMATAVEQNIELR